MQMEDIEYEYYEEDNYDDYSPPVSTTTKLVKVQRYADRPFLWVYGPVNQVYSKLPGK